MFEFLPYGASAKITCDKSSKKGELITNYNSSNEYDTSYQEIGKGGSYFLLSDKERVIMEYSYSKDNGILVEIITNLEVIADNINIQDNGNGHYSIINEDWLENGNGNFKILNEDWFNNRRQEEPYIKLCFNEVKVECCFTNPWYDTWRVYCENGWENLDKEVIKNRLRPYSNSAKMYCTLARYITISWNKKNENQLYYGQPRDDEHWYQIWYSYMDSNNNIIDFDGRKKEQNKNNVINQLFEQRLLSHTQGNELTSYSFTIPPLNGTGEIKGKITNKIIIPYNYFKIGYTINFAGEGTWQPESTLSIKQNNYNYNDNGFIYEEEIDSSVESEDSSPLLYSHPSTENWTRNSKFYLTKNGKYISPSDGLQITSKWTTGNMNF